MSVCGKCGRDAKKLTTHSITNQQLCLRCITTSGIFQLEDDQIIVFKDEKRESIRIPLTVTMSFVLPGDQNTQKEKFSAFGVNVSTSGICFTWDMCSSCHGYLEKDIHEQCIFYPFYISNETRRELSLEMRVTKTYVMVIDAYSVYTWKDDELGFEYVGAQFVNVSNEKRSILEKMIIEYGIQQ